MTDHEQAETQKPIAVPTWFWIAAGLALLFELFGCYMYYSQVTIDPAMLPVDQRAMWDATPPWIVAAYAIAVWVGLAGAVLLLMRRKLAEKLLLISLIAVAVQFGGVMLVPAIREVTPSQAYNLPIAIFVACYGIWMLSRLARKRGWLNGSVVPTNTSPIEVRSGTATHQLTGVGIALLAAGAVGAILSLAMTTSVPTVVGDVSNLDLMNRQQNYLLLSGFLAVVGAILLLVKRR